MEVVHSRCAGIDISKKDAKVCVRIQGRGRTRTRATVTTWGAMSNQILALRDHLLAERWLNREGATSVTGPFTQLDQPTASDIAGDPSAVVDDLDGQLVFHIDVDAEWWWRWRAGQVC